ncbi:adhesion G-protein coupled receptor G2 isoform X2 [Gadus macrocephalus]|uniref:adhesion G-protein coupled receptor G2 isoform X2 n=1 Tax=Gadus macrocephalus TaxID=80720 RepID=UPI0028CB38DF|nr:adhesion G-protein coupled receptor G2 isoform X2 [Gadus macrocephalus]
MSVLNFKVLLKTLRAISNGTSRESCVFQVRVMTSPSDPAEELLRQLLETPYNSMLQRDINISRIYIVKCEGVSHETEKGLFRWPTTKAQSNATLPCPGNAQRNATRHCKLCLSTHWSAPDTNQCLLMVETIPDLDHIDVTPENSMDVVELIQRLLSDHSELTYPELMTVLNKLKSVLNVSLVTPELALALISIISEILESDSDLTPFTNLILEITAAVGDHLQGHSGSFSLEAPALALAVVDLPKGPFSSLSFGVSSRLGVLNPEIHINTVPFLGTVAFISLPSALNQSFPEPDPPSLTPPRVLFQFFGSQRLFKEPESTKRHQRLNTFVVAASVTNASRPITDLDKDVKIMLHHVVPNQLNRSVQCVYWDFNRNRGRGGWDSRGCRTHNTSVDYTTCLCDHLTHFGVLLDVSRTELDPHDEMVLTFITYVGCGVSSLFLGVTVLTYTAFEKLRRDYPSQILINLSLALLSLNVVFLLNSWLSSFGMYGLCVGVASTLHYFLLASFTWMGLEAVNMYLALVKVFNVYVPSYILKFCILGWGIPLVVCVLVLVLNRDAYSSHLYTDTRADVKMLSGFCWIQDDMTFYVTVVGYVGLVLLFNIAVFGVVLMQIRRMRANRPAGISGGLLRDLKGVASLTLLLGLTWTFGFLTWGPARVPLLYLFSALNSLQGLFIFIFHCLMRENVRRQWRMHLCGCLRLEDDSEWSHTVSVGAGRSNPIPTAPLDQSFHSVKSSASNSTSSTSASSEKSDPSTRRPHLALLVNGLAFPRAQAGCSHSEPHRPVAPDGPFASPPPP